MADVGLRWQPSLLDSGEVAFDATFAGLQRRELADGAWVDHQAGWLHGGDRLFARLLQVAPWESRVVHLYGRKVAEPRLTARWRLEEDAPPLPVLADMARALSGRYGVAFTSVGCNLYRDGADSVAWHGDRVARELPEAVIAIVSVGHPRRFRLRPKGGGTSVGYALGRGDLLVMGGSCQRTWDHAVPKARGAGPRISITFRHAYDR
ncbi:MAG: alpha-ketoglutarate-dependent dioxygenase AlkB [Actinomycetota bacterium]|nr:alpha-ketoglutarate-dependent dioxygenase AlkB [Actinomycetota bacterium]